MTEFRLAKDDVAHYSSFEELVYELPKNYKRKNVVKHSTDSEQLEEDRNDFAKPCKACGQTLTYIYGTNVCVCKNPDCKGIKRINKTTGETYYVPVKRILNEKGMEIGMNLFS